MADIKCLICGRVNDSEAERCWYCNAILPKSTSSLNYQEQENIPNSENNPRSNEEDLLTGPKEPQSGSTLEKPGKNTTEDAIPDWLARIRRLKQREEGKLQNAGYHGDLRVPDWQTNLQQHKENDLQVGDAGSISGSKVDTMPVAGISGDINHKNGQEPATGTDREAQMSNSRKDPASRTEDSEAATEKYDPDLELTAIEDSAQAPRQQQLKPENKTSEKPFSIYSDDLPDWLSSDQAEATRKPESLTGEENPMPPSQGKKLEKSKLPDWLKAFRSKDSGIPIPPIEIQQSVFPEGSLLTGIAGTLQGGTLAEQERKHLSFSQEMRVSPIQQKNAEIFARLINQQGPPSQPPSDQPPIKKGNLLPRSLITMLMLLIVILAYSSSNFHGITPVLFPSEVVDSLGLIESLPVEKPVLIAAYFEAGLAGEINWTAQPVLTHLVLRGVPMILTSTNPIGFAILEDQVSRAASGNTGYNLSQKVVDLGYLPGGAIGLSSLVSDPISTLPTTTDLQPTWRSGPAANIHSLADFGSVILITDNPDFARSWVEQISQANEAPPLVAVVSAQAAPLLQPYYDSRQIAGYIAGVNGAIAYELIRGIPGYAYTGFGAYQVILLLVALIIFTGGVVSLMITPRFSEKKKGEV